LIFPILVIAVLLAWWYAAVSDQFIDWFPYPSAARWTLGIVACVLLLAGMGLHAADDGCYIDWDGRSNPTVCD
jgi:hypothetical protein